MYVSLEKRHEGNRMEHRILESIEPNRNCRLFALTLLMFWVLRTIRK